MAINVIKRDGSEEEFNIEKVLRAVHKANESVPESARMTDLEIQVVAERVQSQCEDSPRAIGVEEIQDIVIAQISKIGSALVAKNYTEYRFKRAMARQNNTTDEALLSMIERNNEEVKQENSNKNPTVNSVLRDYMAGEVSKDITNRILLTPDIVQAHKDGIIHFHDTDYFAQHMHNCCLVDLAGMWNWGHEHGEEITTRLSGHGISAPNSFAVAANQATQAVALVASNQYGGQTFTMTDFVGGRHDSDINFVDVSRKKIRKMIIEENAADGLEMTDEQVESRVENRLMKELKSGIQTIQYQLVTLQTTNGQAPFVSVFMYLNECVAKDPQKKKDLETLIRLMLEQRIKGIQDEKGNWITPAFPKLIYVLEDDNIHEGDKYWDLTVLAAKCTAKRMVPDYISEKVMRELKGDVYPCMGCRSFLTPDTEGLGPNREHKYYGRFNQGVVTLNLVDIACSSGKDEKRFWEIMDERLALCHKALRMRHERLLGTPSDVAPILWQDGALGRLESGEKIDKLLFNNYSTISLGYAGLAETVFYMKGVSHTSEEGKKFGLAVMQALNDACKKWRAEENISYSVYGTPIESTTYKFASCLQRRFGIIPGVTDKNYITNSYHVHVTEKIDAFTKLTKEAEFQALSPGGAISYVEVPNMQDNIDAVLTIMKHIYETIMYAELNTKSDLCEVCGYDGEIQVVEDENKKLIWKCPKCGCTDQTKMHVARRTCGYIGTQYWNQGRTQEIKERVLHVSTQSRDCA